MIKYIKLKYCIFILFFLVIFGCKKYYDPQITIFDTFKIERNITLDTIPFVAEDGYMLLCYDTLFFMAAEPINDSLGSGMLRIYNANNFEFITSICQIGNGNNEYISPVFSSQFYLNDLGHIMLNSYNLSKFLYVIDITESIRQNRTIIPIKEDYKKKFNDSDNITPLKDGGYFSKIPAHYQDIRDAEYLGMKYVYEDENGNVQEFSPFSNYIYTDFKPSNPEFYESCCNVSPNGKKAVNVYSMADYIDIIDIEQKKIKGIKHDSSVTFEFLSKCYTIPQIKKLTYYSTGIVATDDMFINLYTKQNMIDMLNPDIKAPSSIRVFDWEGNPLIKINFGIRIYTFTYNKQKRMLYLYDYKRVYYYDMDAILKEVGL